MPRKRKSETRYAEVLAPVPVEVLDQFVREGPRTAAEVEAATRPIQEAIIERALGAELSHHLGYAVGEGKPDAATNHRIGTGGKTVLTDVIPLSFLGMRSGAWSTPTPAGERRRPAAQSAASAATFRDDGAATKPIWFALRNITPGVAARRDSLARGDEPVALLIETPSPKPAV